MAKALVLFVEGPDDVRFFQTVVEPKVKVARHSPVLIYEYATKLDRHVNSYIDILNAQAARFDYLFFVDRDTHASDMACETNLLRRYPKLNTSYVHVVCREIESWYLAGIPKEGLTRLRLPFRGNSTDEISKEAFNRLLPRRNAPPRRVFLINMLRFFSVSEAKSKNVSFRKFCNANGSIVSGA
jgi:hypothetical protein